MAAFAAPIPRRRSGATGFELLLLRAAGLVARRIDRRVELRNERRVLMLAGLHAEQTRKTDPTARDYALAQMGMRLR